MFSEILPKVFSGWMMVAALADQVSVLSQRVSLSVVKRSCRCDSQTSHSDHDANLEQRRYP